MHHLQERPPTPITFLHHSRDPGHQTSYDWTGPWGGGLSLGETCVYFTSEGDWVDYLVTKRMVLCIKYFQLSPWHRQCCASWPCVVMRDMTSSGHHYVVK